MCWWRPLYVDQETGAPLAEPVRLPLEIERRIRTVPGESSARTVVVQELVTFRVSGIDQRETHQYVMDRRSMQNQDDPRSWSYTPDNVVDRAGTYRVNPDLGTDGDDSYRTWENEPGAGFSTAAEPGGHPTSAHGLTLLQRTAVVVPADQATAAAALPMEEVFAGVALGPSGRGASPGGGGGTNRP